MNRFISKHLTAILAASLLVTAPGCKKYLDQKPITEVSSDVVFSDVSSAYKALIAAYSRLAGQEGYGQRLSLYYTVDTDEMQGPTGASDGDRRDIARYSATSGNAQIEKPFNQLFQGIEYANICIDNIPKMALYTSGSDQEKKQLQRMYGEALTLRAQFYFEAIRNWGDLPEHFTSAANQALQDPFPARTDRDVLYGKLLEDLKTAEGLVPWRNEVASIGDPADERITKGTIKGIRARMALYRGGYSLRQDGTMKRGADYLTYYQMAKEETNDIMTSGQHSLNPSFRSLWKDQVNAHAVTDPNGELMFQVASVGGTSIEDSRLAYYNGPRMGSSIGNGAINVLGTYFYLFDSTDTRRDVTIATYTIAANGTTKTGLPITTITDGKWRRDWITNPSFSPTFSGQFLGLKWQILRYSDVLLMFAEAENELNGPTAAAYNALNMVRRRGYGKPIGTADPAIDLSSLSKTDFFKAIVRERSLELGGEGVRKYDLIRWNLLGTALTETKANLAKLAAATAMTGYSYMLNPPTYALTGTLPIAMYYKNNSTADDVNLWANSFYKAAPASTPSGTTKVNWLTSAITTTSTSRLATGYTGPGRAELLPVPNAVRTANPNFGQNPGY
ncbi:MAG TPA: RagB/SusD family nutrient uptake outer membrane protein [Flavisolibacter sp.]|jgi:hypothetical protein|nr:RagB/SusD family nutrient uptake outer membrane protein [Flavisolibacter sp.]